MIIPIPDQLQEAGVPILAGLVVSLINRFILNNPHFGQSNTSHCETNVEEFGEDEMLEEISDNSGNASATLETHNMHHTSSHTMTH